jgi:hypothetical protein
LDHQADNRSPQHQDSINRNSPSTVHPVPSTTPRHFQTSQTIQQEIRQQEFTTEISPQHQEAINRNPSSRVHPVTSTTQPHSPSSQIIIRENQQQESTIAILSTADNQNQEDTINTNGEPIQQLTISTLSQQRQRHLPQPLQRRKHHQESTTATLLTDHPQHNETATETTANSTIRQPTTSIMQTTTQIITPSERETDETNDSTQSSNLIQQTIPQYDTHPVGRNEAWGASINNLPPTTFRVFFQNINGLQFKTNNSKWQPHLNYMKEKGIAISGLAETNSNWHHKYLTKNIITSASSVFNNVSVAFTDSSFNPPDRSSYLPGGCLQI